MIKNVLEPLSWKQTSQLSTRSPCPCALWNPRTRVWHARPGQKSLCPSVPEARALQRARSALRWSALFCSPSMRCLDQCNKADAPSLSTRSPGHLPQRYLPHTSTNGRFDLGRVAPKKSTCPRRAGRRRQFYLNIQPHGRRKGRRRAGSTATRPGSTSLPMPRSIFPPGGRVVRAQQFHAAHAALSAARP